jgi:uncharacterized protein YggE
MLRHVQAWSILFLFGFLVRPPVAFPQASSAEPVLTVQGSSEIRVAPDFATVRLGVAAQAVTADMAQNQVNQAASRILEAVRRVGIDDRDVQTTRLVLSPVYSRQAPGGAPPDIVAYRAQNTVSVRLERLELVGSVIDAGLGAGANTLDGVMFGVLDDLPAREAALAEAIAEARRKAETMARALDVELVRVLAVEEGGVFVQRPQAEMARLATFQEAIPTPVSPGEVTVSASVTLRYQIQED